VEIRTSGDLFLAAIPFRRLVHISDTIAPPMKRMTIIVDDFQIVVFFLDVESETVHGFRESVIPLS
jgi:hypothetical protein